jgi:hypothetical protein
MAIAQLPNCLIIDTEGGSAAHEALTVTPENFAEFIHICNLIKNGPTKYDFVCIDTIGMVEDWCVTEGTEMYKSSNTGRNFTGDDVTVGLEHGAGYLWLRKAFKRAIDASIRLAPHVIFTCHIKDKLLTGGSTQDAGIKQMDLTGKISAMFSGKLDAIGQLVRRPRLIEKEATIKTIGKPDKIVKTQVACPYDDGLLIFKGNENTTVAGCRIAGLAGKTIKLIDGETQQVDWSQLYPSLRRPPLDQLISQLGTQLGALNTPNTQSNPNEITRHS